MGPTNAQWNKLIVIERWWLSYLTMDKECHITSQGLQAYFLVATLWSVGENVQPPLLKARMSILPQKINQCQVQGQRCDLNLRGTESLKYCEDVIVLETSFTLTFLDTHQLYLYVCLSLD